MFREDDPDRAPLETVSVELEVSRQRMISWAIFGTIFGALLVWRLGTVAVWAGWGLIGVGAFRAYQLVQSFLHPAGTIVVSEKQVSLPVGLHRAHPITVTPAEVSAVYFLRRSVPLYHAAPVLVVELGDRAMLFPRDWFASEADQRHVVHALLSQRRNLVPESAAGEGPSNVRVVVGKHGPGYIGTSGREILAGAIFTLIGVAGVLETLLRGGHGFESISALVVGSLVLWRGLTVRF